VPGGVDLAAASALPRARASASRRRSSSLLTNPYITASTLTVDGGLVAL